MPNPKVKEIALVVFKKEQDVVLAGVQCTKWDIGWKGSLATLTKDGVLFSFPGHRDCLVPMSGIRQIEFASGFKV